MSDYDDDPYELPEGESTDGEGIDDDDPRTQEGRDADASEYLDPDGPDPERY